jgi:hypothetical protein
MAISLIFLLCFLTFAGLGGPRQDDDFLPLRSFFLLSKGLIMIKFLVSLAAVTLIAALAAAQDMPGVENCSAEKAMDRRTGCLQANVNYLQTVITKNAADGQQKLTAANAEISSLKASVARLQASVDQLAAAAKKAEEAAKKAAETKRK